MPLNSCILTNLPIQGYTELDDAFQYQVNIRGVLCTLKFPIGEDLDISYKRTLKSLLYRSEWPFDKDYTITKQLIERFFRYTNYPKITDFEPRVLLYLEWIYNNGGEENYELVFDPTETWIVDAKDDSEFSRILEKLQQRDYITTTTGNKFKLSKPGLIKIEEIINSRPKRLITENPSLIKPRISIIGVEKDHLAIGKLNNYFSRLRFNSTSFDRIIDGPGDSSAIFNTRPTIKREGNEAPVDYWIFVKSKNSDKSNGFGTLLTIAMEAQTEFGAARYPNMISIASIDDGKFDSWPMYHHYHSHFFDIRINAGKEMLVDCIFEDWVAFQNKKWKTVDSFWEWLIDGSKVHNTTSLLLRPTDFEEHLHSENQLQKYLEELAKNNLISYSTSPGCGKDSLEYHVFLLNKEQQGGTITENPTTNFPALANLEILLKNFHKAAIKLREIRDKKKAIKIKNEYDVQDILNSYLQLHFNDVRTEEFNISNACSNTRIDFVLKNENIAIEVKMASNTLKDKALGEQLLIDIGKYKSHPNCKTLVLFIYDNGDFIANKAALIKDLENQKTSTMDVRVVISP